jgi:hypothetical protein
VFRDNQDGFQLTLIVVLHRWLYRRHGDQRIEFEMWAL